jgi:SAM-dependent methyltransferase
MADDDLEQQLASGRRRLRQKLRELDLESAGLSDYNRRYLGQKLAGVDAQLELDADLLRLCLASWTRPLRDFVLVDYGGGTGILAFLAKEIGIGTVVYEDIYDVSCRDADRVARMLDLELDHVVCGDVEELVSMLHANGLAVNAIASYDVLEHIYDVQAHFQELARAPMSAEYFRLVYGSGANIKNRRYVRTVMKVQRAEEYEDRPHEWGHKERDTLRAFLDIRREVIAEYAPELSGEQVEWLARATRGLRKDDIERTVDEYRSTGTVSYRPDHPTNTCDPITGNWSEHLMEPHWIEGVLRDAGFEGHTLAGRYSVSGSRPKRAAKQVLNVAIRIFGRRALAIAPFYVIYATRRS